MGGRNEGEGTRVVVVGGEWKELVPATEPRDFHILQTLSTSELHLRSWKSLIYPLPIYLCFLNLLQETYCFHSYKKKRMLFSIPICYIFGVGPPWTTACGAVCVLLFLKSHYFVFSHLPILGLWKEGRLGFFISLLSPFPDYTSAMSLSRQLITEGGTHTSGFPLGAVLRGV